MKEFEDHSEEDALREAQEEAACTCEPQSPDDQCPVHGFEIWMRERALAEARPAKS